MSQSELGTKLGISQAAIAQIESRDSKAQKETVKKITVTLGIDMDQLIDQCTHL